MSRPATAAGCRRSRPVRRKAIVALLALVAAMGMPGQRADAHPFTDCWSGANPTPEFWCVVFTWQPDNIAFKFSADFPAHSGIFPARDRVFDSYQNWPILSSGRPSVSVSSPDGAGGFTVNCETYADGDNRFHFVDLAALEFYTGDLLGWTCVKYNEGRVVAANPAADSKEAWWPYDSAPPADRFDLESTYTHEMGHAFGYYGHFNPDDLGCFGAPTTMYTMCANSGIIGTLRVRTVEVHDRHTMQAAYVAFP
jgi:hypothetical protein